MTFDFERSNHLEFAHGIDKPNRTENVIYKIPFVRILLTFIKENVGITCDGFGNDLGLIQSGVIGRIGRPVLANESRLAHPVHLRLPTVRKLISI